MLTLAIMPENSGPGYMDSHGGRCCQNQGSALKQLREHMELQWAIDQFLGVQPDAKDRTSSG